MPLSLRSWAAGLFGFLGVRANESVAVAFDRSQLPRRQLDPIELPADFRLQRRRQFAPVPGSQRLEPFETIAPERIVIPDAPSP